MSLKQLMVPAMMTKLSNWGPKIKGPQFDNFVITAGNISCHHDNLWCPQWWQSCQIDDPLFSMSQQYHIGQSLVDSPHKGPVMWKAFPCHDIIMSPRPFDLNVIEKYSTTLSTIRAYAYVFFFLTKDTSISHPHRLVFQTKLSYHDETHLST